MKKRRRYLRYRKRKTRPAAHKQLILRKEEQRQRKYPYLANRSKEF